MEGIKKVSVPSEGFEPSIFGLGDRRLIRWATRAACRMDEII